MYTRFKRSFARHFAYETTFNRNNISVNVYNMCDAIVQFQHSLQLYWIDLNSDHNSNCELKSWEKEVEIHDGVSAAQTY